jgi:hypothetical protein
VAERYDSGRRQAEFRVGDLVLVRLHPQSSKSQQRSAKLDFKWSMPLVIVKYVFPVTVLLANPDTGVIIRKAHVSQLKPHFSGRQSLCSGIFMCCLGDYICGISTQEGIVLVELMCKIFLLQ